MATLTVANPTVVVADPPMERVTMIIKNGQSWKAGEFLNADSSGLNECASNDDAGAAGIKYYALTDQSDPGNTTTTAVVGVVRSDIIFEGNELDGQLAQTTIGDICGIDVTSNVVTVDVDDSTNPAVQIVDVGFSYNPALYDATDTKAKCKFRVLASVVDAEQA